jgi:hypothetical protein
MTPEAIFNVWCEKSFRKKPSLEARFSQPEAKAEFLARPEVAELSTLPDHHVMAALLAHINLELAVAEAHRLGDRARSAPPVSQRSTSGLGSGRRSSGGSGVPYHRGQGEQIWRPLGTQP